MDANISRAGPQPDPIMQRGIKFSQSGIKLSLAALGVPCCKHAEKYTSESHQIKPNLHYNYTFRTDVASNGIQLGVKSTGKV